MAVDELNVATPQATSRALASAPLGIATITTANSLGFQSSTHNYRNNTSATLANAKAKAINATRKLADLASKADSKVVVDALSELVIQLAYWVPLENIASLITKVVKEGL